MRACSSRAVLSLALLFLCGALGSSGCSAAEPRKYSFYDERIEPVLAGGCARQTTGCHTDDGEGFALGNLDLGSYEALVHRSDALVPYGPYPVGLLLLKAGDPIEIDIETVDPPDPAEPERRRVRIRTDIRHGGGEGAIAEGSRDYAALKQWIERGYAPDGVARDFPGQNHGRCSTEIHARADVDLTAEPADPESYLGFVDDVLPGLVDRCAGSSCHGASTAGLHISCGETEEQRRASYYNVLGYLSEVAVSSELLRRPLALSRGGVFHEGGDIFLTTDDGGYRTLLAFAEDVAERAPELLRFEPEDAGVRFFANRVQPVLVRKGCMFLGCHSPAMFHDLRLRGGASGAFSPQATIRNYEMSKLLLALESEDPNASRLIAKNLCPDDAGGVGMRHRGGALLEDFGSCAAPEGRASLEHCASVDAEAGDLNEVPAYCVLARWQELERELAIERGELPPPAATLPIVFVTRPEGIGGPTEIDAFRPGADLVRAELTRGADGTLSLSGTTSVLGACGLGASVDVRGPAVSWDGTRVAFAARAAEDEPLRLYEMAPDGTGCAPIANVAPDASSQNGILLHDFDPAYAPDGRLVFASTRGYLDGDLGVRGPTRTPARLEPNANLYVLEPDGTVRQLTYLLDQELAPSFMTDGRVIFTTEKRSLDFHQLAGRRINLDGGDYHPLFAQRPSVGFASATEIVELANRNLAFVASSLDARDGGGSIVVVNRSIGPDQSDRDPRDRAYIHALTKPTPGAVFGEQGVFRSPSPLSWGGLLAACDLDAADIAATPHYGLCALDPAGHEPPRELYLESTHVALEPVAVYARAPRETFSSRLDEANGATRVRRDATGAEVHVLDVRVLGSLLFSNTREGRPIDARVDGVALYMAEPPPVDATNFDALGDSVVEDAFGRYFESLRRLGSARAAGDGSLRARVPAGAALSIALTDGDGDVLSFPSEGPFGGPMRQREAFQLYPGERANVSLKREQFDGLCAGCHGSVDGRELDVGVRVDVLTHASLTFATEQADLTGR